MSMAEVEESVRERLAPSRTLAFIENLMPAILEKTAERLKKKTVVEGAKMIATDYACTYCKNRDQGYFEEDSQHGQITCMRCGTVIQDRKIHDGEWKRQFSGDDNPSQHGPVPDSRFSSGHNLRTNITSGSGKGAAAKVTKKELADLKNIQDKVEMNLSNMKHGVDVRMTRIGYKDKQKREVFLILEELGGSMQIHEKVIQEAQGYFADYREALEQIQARDAVVAACLILALRNTVGSGDSVRAEGTGPIKRKLDAAAARNVRSRLTFEELHPFPCATCGQQFASKKDLRFHTRQCKGAPKPPAAAAVKPEPGT